MSIDWAYAGGPNECKHGFAEGIPCEKCGPHKVEYEALGIRPNYIETYGERDEDPPTPFDPLEQLKKMRAEARAMLDDTHRENRRAWARCLVALDAAIDRVPPAQRSESTHSCPLVATLEPGIQRKVVNDIIDTLSDTLEYLRKDPSKIMDYGMARGFFREENSNEFKETGELTFTLKVNRKRSE